jgi:hypothetical protein
VARRRRCFLLAGRALRAWHPSCFEARIAVRTRRVDIPTTKLRARVTAGSDAGRACESRHGKLVIGSGEGVDLILSDRRVSTKHVELEVAADGVVVRDLGSEDGTLVGTIRIREIVIQEAIELSLGESHVHVEIVHVPGRDVSPIAGDARLDALFGFRLRDALASFERAYLDAVVKRARGNVAEAAKLAGLNRATMYRALQRHGLKGD